MPALRCSKCNQAYDVPASVAMKLPIAIARCTCGEWLSGSRAALLSRMIDPDDLEEIDMRMFRISDTPRTDERVEKILAESFTFSGPRSVRVIARGADESVNTVFTIGEHPLFIGRKASHIEIDDAELSIRHCSISRRRSDLILRDEDSHTGTFLDGEPVTEVALGDGVHIVRAGGAIISVEPVSEAGIPVEPLSLEVGSMFEAPPELMRRAARPGVEAKNFLLVCLEGPCQGKRFEIPDEGLIIGREGTLPVKDDYLSRKHFAVSHDPEGGIRLRDLGSRNGTFLNTLPARNARLHPGDEIRAGASLFRLDEVVPEE